MQKEKFKNVIGYEGYYQVSNLGNVKSLERNVPCKNGAYTRYIPEKYLKPQLDAQGYYHVILVKNGEGKLFKVHRLVAEHFLKDWDSSLTVDHVNGCKADNSASNLRMLTREANSKFNPMTKEDARTILIRMPDEAMKDLNALADEDLRSNSAELRWLIQDHIQRTLLSTSKPKLDFQDRSNIGETHRFLLTSSLVKELRNLRKKHKMSNTEIIQNLIMMEKARRECV